MPRPLDADDEDSAEEGLDALLDVDTGKGRYEGPTEVVDPKEAARRLRLRSNMDPLIAEHAPERKPGPTSDLDLIFRKR